MDGMPTFTVPGTTCPVRPRRAVFPALRGSAFAPFPPGTLRAATIGRRIIGKNFC